ncbi:SgcJ/EcaC family oxidoreductase [Mucilaginibacter aquaedulcis]|uniref:SgcJ/EcaC family oxidoreductase n=1 Tax=Mucilaginibacter aquaedulcis TaxID=1187081 RepID=UPI0025B4736D|nr:SgcJ/EcaC family oxidoreductase [Mucilaginibacter aquaedulcis]MDN3551253.1 SgcJ/EcaC family oxidoreductase [Mucilaginibacter aquaedulcis]
MMKKVFVMLWILAGTILIVKAQDRSLDEAGIKSTLARFGNSWKKGDFRDMNEYLTPDCHWINIVGMHWHNLKEVQFAHQAFIGSALKGVETKEISIAIRFITQDVAIAYWLTHIGTFYPPDGINRGGNKQGDKDNIATVVLVKQKGQWWITSAQNNDVISQAAASDPVLHMNK